MSVYVCTSTERSEGKATVKGKYKQLDKRGSRDNE